jgi:hypothetical protein
MADESRFKKRLYTATVVVGLALGSVGIAAAASGGSAPADPAPEATDVQEPSYTGSVKAPAEDETLSEADEAAQLEGLASIAADEAAAAASGAVSGTVEKVELDNENGSVVYSVEITDDTGTEVDVKVDAGDGTILDQQADDEADEAELAEEAEGADEADDDDVQHENEHEGEDDPDEGHED